MRWRDWKLVMEALPRLEGSTVLDLGCGTGACAAELESRGARVIGFDFDRASLQLARARCSPDSEFHEVDLHRPIRLDLSADGIWCSFVSAYFPRLPIALKNWGTSLKEGGWIAITEIDDLFGHEPVQRRTKSYLDAYAEQALAACRYDFRMGRKLVRYLEESGFVVSKSMTLRDLEFSFQGRAMPEVIESWRERFERMRLLRHFCGADFESVRDDFLDCLTRPEHRASAAVQCCVAFLLGVPRM